MTNEERRKAAEWCRKRAKNCPMTAARRMYEIATEALEEPKEALPSAQPEQRWIPFKTRSLTEEEKEEHPEWDCILDCILPDDGQAILVSINLKGHERVQYDEFYTDDGCYLDSGYALGSEATAWMPLPAPYRREGGQE